MHIVTVAGLNKFPMLSQLKQQAPRTMPTLIVGLVIACGKVVWVHGWSNGCGRGVCCVRAVGELVWGGWMNRWWSNAWSNKRKPM